MALTIFNTLTRNKDPFTPLTPGKIGLYVCGPTVYDLSHVGHARVYTAFDTIVRFMRRHFEVRYVRNYTDVDDKIIAKATKEKSTPTEVSEKNIAEFQADMASLGNLPADVEPKVTEHIQEVIDICQALVDKGAAYEVRGDLYYAVNKFPNYGRLGRRTLEDMEAGIRVEVNSQKRHPMDFVLWKTAKPGEPAWESPWGLGRPGWHIECSGMSRKYLGESFDIHGGGRDLIFPHHENEVAQSEAACEKPYAAVWMHGGLVNIDNEKMSKSLGNFFTIRQVLEKFDSQTLRYYLLATHYRSPINFSDAALKEAEARLCYCFRTLARIDAKIGKRDATADASGPWRSDTLAELSARFEAAMMDDFNTPQAIGELSEAFAWANTILEHPEDAQKDARTLRHIQNILHDAGGILGLFEEDAQKTLSRIEAKQQKQRGVDVAQIEQLVAARQHARDEKNFARADEIRGKLQSMGVLLLDSPGKTQWRLE